jgi:hypothetical protein
MKDSIKRRIEAIERTVAEEIGPERVPIIEQQGLGGPFMCDGVSYPDADTALAAYADHEDVVLVSIVDGRKPKSNITTSHI